MVALAPTPRPRRAAITGPSPAAAVQKTYAYGNDIDEVIQIRDHRPTARPTDQYADQDDLFSVVALTDANGNVTERFRYGDYGNREALTAAGSPSGSTELRHGFTGRLHDDLVGLIEYRHRWMQPGTGTFVQRDPLGYVDGMSLYAYSVVSPYVLVDPNGLSVSPESPIVTPGLPSQQQRERHTPPGRRVPPRMTPLRWLGRCSSVIGTGIGIGLLLTEGIDGTVTYLEGKSRETITSDPKPTCPNGSVCIASMTIRSRYITIYSQLSVRGIPIPKIPIMPTRAWISRDIHYTYQCCPNGCGGVMSSATVESVTPLGPSTSPHFIPGVYVDNIAQDDVTEVKTVNYGCN